MKTKQFLLTISLRKDVKDLIDLVAGRAYTIDGVTDVEASDVGAKDPLGETDFEDLKRQAIEQYAGAWLHHWGRLIEAEVIKRQARARAVAEA